MPTPFTVMTWNVENLFPPGFPIAPNRVVEAAAYQAKLAYLAKIIRRVEPDVLALQEIGGSHVDDSRSLSDLGDQVADLLPHRALSTNPDSRPGGGGIRVGFLSRLPLAAQPEVVSFAPGELSQVPNWNTTPPRPPVTRLGRGALPVDVEPVPGVRIRLVAAHLKSKLLTFPGPNGRPAFTTDDEDERATGAGLALLRRTAEAVTLRRYVCGVLQSGDPPHVVLLGDLNDEPDAATTQLLLGPEDADVTSSDKYDRVRLYNLTDAIPLRGQDPEGDVKRFLSENERFSRLYKGRGELIDHILVSRGLLGAPEQNRQDRWLVREVRSLVDSITGQSIDDSPTERIGKECPDHAPIYARFEL